jgi:acyl-coenzyme A synthetase/AMP-(fatty) acid ligase
MNATAIIRRGKTQQRVRVPSRTRSRVIPMVLQATVVFFAVFIIGSFALSLGGHILAEGQRAQIRQMSKPLLVAREQDRQLKASSSSDKSQESIEEWAIQRGFVRKYAPVIKQQETYVAHR